MVHDWPAAISPAEVAAIETLTRAGGLDFVDGAISGAAPGPEDRSTRILLSGATAARVADLPWDGLAVSVVGTRAGAASAAKMCTGGVRKGLSALVINALLTAEANGVLEPVIAELERALRRDPVVDAELAASKAWRFAPEMDSVADTQEAAGLDPSTYRAIAEVFRRTARSPLAELDPEHVHRGARTAAESAAAVAGLRALPGS